ncbi:MAG: SpoIIE family protein phosphatase [Leptospirales bacterium]|nr:SpoIIE family protein phosphatase [Leptospirales bacterium]
MRALVVLIFVFLSACAREKEIVSLSGGWEFKKGYQTSFLDPADSGWEPVQVPGTISDQKKISTPGWVTVRRSIPSTAAEHLAQGAAALSMGWTSDVTVYYINGQKIGQIGQDDPYESGLFRLFLKELPAIPSREPNMIHVAMYTDGAKPLQFDGDPIIGRGSAVFSEYYFNEIVSFFLLGIYFVVGVYHLLLFSRRSKDRHNLMFGLFCMLLTVYWLNRSGVRDSIFGNHVILRLKVEYVSLFFIPATLMYFLSLFFYQRFSKVGGVIFGFAVILSLTTIFAPYSIAKRCLTIWQYSSIPVIGGYGTFYILREVFRKNKDARWLAFGVIVLVVAGLHDIAVARHWIPGTHIARFAFILFVLSIAAVLANRFMRVHNEVEHLNEKLEDKVKIRTQQLTETLDEVQKLKIQQDGDYFLTSLLIQPLTGNYVQSPNVSVDMLLRQKKQFQFRHWQAEIGGDLCIAQNIQLKEKTYTVFLNGDAMGKSIQGAGGALVLGTVFKSMVARTQMTPAAQDKYPEQWLKECFLELQNVFVSFDGSMMVSAVFGLVDELSGLLYYINAEHPFVVLYRDKAAEFLENDITLRKLGVSGLSGVLQVKTCQLQPNDVVIIGSDGRDDVQIGVDENGNRIINENEMEFLRHVEKGEANLRKIEQSILSFGTLTDDFTLLRIGFKETGVLAREVDENNRIAAYKAEVRKARALALDGKLDEAIFILEQAMDITDENSSAMRLLSRVLIQRRLFDRAANVSESYTLRFPADTEFLYVTSYAYAKSGALDRAISFAERCRLRDPSMVRNLLHLAKLYKESGRADLAERALEDALQTDPTHEKAKLFLADLAN